MEALAIRHRPATFTDLAGQRPVHVVLKQMIATGRVPTALLFAGPRGTGKTTTARILAAALNCEHDPAPERPCTRCVSCKAVAAGTSMDLVEIDAASHGLVEDIRALRSQVLYGVGGHWRVVVLDEAHSMSGPAFNALLKTLEEPPPATVFILATTEAHRIPDTVTSRCMPFRFSRLSVADIAARLDTIATAENLPVQPELLHLLAGRADGALRDAVMALDQATRAGIGTAADYRDLIGETDPGPDLLTACADGDHARLYQLTDQVLHHSGDPGTVTAALIATLRDLLIIHSGGTPTAAAGALTARQQLAHRIPTPATVAALSVLWEARTRLCGPDPRTALDLTLAMLADKLAPTTAPATATTTRRLTLADLAARR